MIERFSGEVGRRILLDALLGQFVVNNDGSIAADLADKVTLRSFAPGEVLIEEGASDNEMFFILSGLTSVKIKDREQARRSAGQHVGEMALIDVSAARSATVEALDQTVVALVSEADFSELAAKYPVLWRRLALTLGKRLRERGNSVRPKNETARIFIGSSSEGLDIARAIQNGLSHDPYVVQVWTDDVFKASKTSIESLLTIAESSDFGVLVLSEDDSVESRGMTFDGPRDNVVFELGLLMGSIGRERTLMVSGHGSKIKMPTDLIGTTPLQYKTGREEDLPSRVATVCSEIRTLAKKLGPK